MCKHEQGNLEQSCLSSAAALSLFLSSPLLARVLLTDWMGLTFTRPLELLRLLPSTLRATTAKRLCLPNKVHLEVIHLLSFVGLTGTATQAFHGSA